MNYRNTDAASAARFAAALHGCRRILILGGYGCGNLGDEAILAVLLREVADVGADVRVLSADPDHTRRIHGVTGVAAQPASLARALAWCDAVVVGGGGIFSGYMGGRSKLLPLLALLARAGHRRVLFRALGVYATTPRLVLRALAAAASNAAFASVRDETSARVLVAAGLRGTPDIEPDPALRLRPEASDVWLPKRPFGLALRRVRDADMQAGLEVEFVALLDGLIAAGHAPILLPFCDHPNEPVEQDVGYARSLQSRCMDPAAVLVARPERPEQMLHVVQRLDAIVAMRFHAIVFGAMARTPLIALPYDDKCRDFAGERDITSIALESFEAGSVITMFAPEAARRVRVERKVAA